MSGSPEKTERRKVTLTVDAEAAGSRLDAWVASQENLRLSRNKVQKLIDDADITVNGMAEPARFQLKGGETVTILMPLPPTTKLRAEAIALDIVYEDEYLAVINKPVGMVMYPAAGNSAGTLANALVHHFKSLPESKGGHRPGIVHRLDKNTSGLLLIAKQEPTLERLQTMLANREVKRTYLAIICGHMPKETGKIDLPIGRSPQERTKMAVVDNGRPAVTEYQLKERFRSVELHEVNLQTGRTHQIRVHFAHKGHPVLGDPEYGGREKWVKGIFAPERPLAKKLLSILDHQALHACRLALKHPETGEELVCESDVPEDYGEVLSILRSQAK